jgi:hypothetical protein
MLEWKKARASGLGTDYMYGNHREKEKGFATVDDVTVKRETMRTIQCSCFMPRAICCQRQVYQVFSMFLTRG